MTFKGVMRHAEGLELIEIVATQKREYGARRWALHCERGDAVRNVLYRDIKAQGVPSQPIIGSLIRAEAKLVI